MHEKDEEFEENLYYYSIRLTGKDVLVNDNQ